MARTGKWSKYSLAGLVVLGAAAAALALAWWWPRTPSPAPNVAKTLLSQPVPLACGVYLLGRSSPSAVYAVTTSEGLVLIDSGVEADAATVLSQLAELHLDVSRLRAILLTHVHGDHSLGAAHLRALTGGKIYAGRGDCKPLREGGPREAFFSVFHMPDVKVHPTPVDTELAGDEIIELGDTRILAVAAPGHTPGSICYLLERTDLRVLFTGDVVLCLGPGKQNALGTYSAHLPPAYGGNAGDYLRTLRQLRALPLPDLVLPGHPAIDQLPQSPRLTQKQWESLLDEGIREMLQLIARYDADGADFLDGVPKELLPGLHYLGDVEHTPVYCIDSAKGLFLFNAPGGSALVDFLSARFKELGWESRKPSAVLLTSADEAVTAGLEALVRKTGCKVVAPSAGIEAVQRFCPERIEILTEQELELSDWFPARAIPLAGRGRAPLAYEVRWAGKTVVFTGRIPTKLSVPWWSVPTVEALERDMRGAKDRAADYLRSLDELRELKPDLWLPAAPIHGQNANLYEQDWSNVLSQNRRVVEASR